MTIETDCKIGISDGDEEQNRMEEKVKQWPGGTQSLVE